MNHKPCSTLGAIPATAPQSEAGQSQKTKKNAKAHLQARRVIGAQQRQHPIVRVGASPKHTLSHGSKFQTACSITRASYILQRRLLIYPFGRHPRNHYTNFIAKGVASL